MRCFLGFVATVGVLASLQVGLIFASTKWKTSFNSQGQGHPSEFQGHRKGEGHNRHDHAYESSHHGHKKTKSREVMSSISPQPSQRESENIPSYKPFVPPYIESPHFTPEIQQQEVNKVTEVKDADVPNVRVERVERPRKSQESRKHRNKSRSNEGLLSEKERKATNDLYKGHPDKKHVHPEAKSGKKVKKKSETKQGKKSRKECEKDEDCEGACCVPTKKGKKFCKKSSTKALGEKCATSCVCKPELRCFVGEYKRNGETRVHKSKKRIMGRCIEPTTADYNEGYFVDQLKV